MKTTKRKPKNWIENGYTIRVPFDFQWRATLGKVTCDCTEVIERFEPYYGFTFFHSENCAIRKHLEKYPQMENLLWDRDPRVIAMSD